MAKARILALIMAGGEGGRLEVLTRRRAKPALPYGGVYRLIDFPLSHCMHSAISDVWVLQQYNPRSLSDHLANGRPWDLDRTYGGLRVLHPFTGADESGWHQGNADAIHRHKGFIVDFGPDVVLVLSSDHVYKLDYKEVIEAHLDRRADVTMVTTEVPRREAGRFGAVESDGDGRVTGFEYKPEAPRSGVVTTEVFAYDPRRLLATLEDIAASGGAEGGEGGGAGSLKDFGHELLPRLIEGGRAYEHRLEGYWRDVGTPASYWESHMDLLEPEPPLVLDDDAWPILSRGVQRAPARLFRSAEVDRSLISSGCEVRGEVVRSVLGPGVVVEEGAVVHDSVIFRRSAVGPGARVEAAVLDKEVQVGKGARVGESDAGPDLVLVGQGARIGPGAKVPPGARLEPEAVEGTDS